MNGMDGCLPSFVVCYTHTYEHKGRTIVFLRMHKHTHINTYIRIHMYVCVPCLVIVINGKHKLKENVTENTTGNSRKS